MNTFLHGAAIKRAVTECMSQRAPASIAVAFWGKGSAKHLTDARGRQVSHTRVICDLWSGYCDPAEIRRLLEFGIQVKTLDGLHAKVWQCDHIAVVGSANASANGLGFDEIHNRANWEASVRVEDTVSLASIRSWFAGVWTEAKVITDQDLAEVVELRRTRLRQGMRLWTPSILDALRASPQPDFLRSVKIVAYQPDDTPKRTRDAFDAILSLEYSEDELSIWPGEEPYYVDSSCWNLSPGNILIDFQRLTSRREFRFCGIWEVRKAEPVVVEVRPGECNIKIIPCKPLVDVRGYRLSELARTEFALRLKRLVVKNDWWSLSANKEHHFCNVDQPILEFWSQTESLR